MEAKVNEKSGVFTVTLSGQLDFESADALRAKCRHHFLNKKVIFDIAHLNFVGSSGITPFLGMLGDLLKSNGNALKVCSAGTEFMRIFEAGGLNGLEVYESESQARLAFEHPPYNSAFSTLNRVGPLGIDSDLDVE